MGLTGGTGAEGAAAGRGRLGDAKPEARVSHAVYIYKLNAHCWQSGPVVVCMEKNTWQCQKCATSAAGSDAGAYGTPHEADCRH